MKIKISILLTACFLISSCSMLPSSLTSSKEKNKIENVKIYKSDNLSNVKYKYVRKIEGYTCLSSGGTENMVRDEIRYKASQYDANGLMNYVCDPKEAIIFINCDEAIQCSADAIIIEEKNLNAPQLKNISLTPDEIKLIYNTIIKTEGDNLQTKKLLKKLRPLL